MKERYLYIFVHDDGSMDKVSLNHSQTALLKWLEQNEFLSSYITVESVDANEFIEL